MSQDIPPPVLSGTNGISRDTPLFSSSYTRKSGKITVYAAVPGLSFEP